MSTKLFDSAFLANAEDAVDFVLNLTNNAIKFTEKG
jgi:hypothetical protein